MIAIIVATPLQLFNSMVIMRHHFNGERADLFALNIACDMHSFISVYKNLECINNVYYIDDIAQNINSKLTVFKEFAFTTKSQRKFLKNILKENYTDLFTTWIGISGDWVLSKLIKRNPAIKVHFYEEGLGVYMKGMYSAISPKLKLLYNILGYKSCQDFVTDNYVYRPNFIFEGNKMYPPVAIGDVTDADLKYLHQDVKNVHLKPYSQKCIYFENNFENTVYAGIDENIIINHICDAVGKEHVAIRIHPRTNPEKYTGMGYVMDENLSVSWEDIVPLCDNLNDIVLITTLSTAAFSPMLSYGKQPKVLIVAKAIINEHNNCDWAKEFWTKEMENFVLNFKANYHNSEDVQIPETYDEMCTILKNWK